MATFTCLNEQWVAIAPQSDSDELAALGRRCLLYLSHSNEPKFLTAPANMLTAGWVIGFQPE